MKKIVYRIKIKTHNALKCIHYLLFFWVFLMCQPVLYAQTAQTMPDNAGMVLNAQTFEKAQQALQDAYQAEKAVCVKKFFVNSCLNEAQKQHRQKKVGINTQYLMYLQKNREQQKYVDELRRQANEARSEYEAAQVQENQKKYQDKLERYAKENQLELKPPSPLKSTIEPKPPLSENIIQKNQQTFNDKTQQKDVRQKALDARVTQLDKIVQELKNKP